MFWNQYWFAPSVVLAAALQMFSFEVNDTLRLHANALVIQTDLKAVPGSAVVEDRQSKKVCFLIFVQ